MRTIDLQPWDEITPLSEINGNGYHLSAARKRIVDRVVYRHSVPNCLLHVTLAGRLKRFTGRFGDRTPTVRPSRPGDISYAPPGWERFGALEEGDVVAVEVALAPELVTEAAEQAIDLEYSGGFFNEADGKATALVRAIVETGTDHADDCTRDILVLALARHVGMRMGGATYRRDDAWLHPAALRRIIERIDADPTSPPRLDELARIAGLGPSALIRAFRGSVGMTPSAFSQRSRLNYAHRAILRSDAPIEQIMFDFGFSSKSHFITAFRKQFGATPGRIRTENRPHGVGVGT